MLGHGRTLININIVDILVYLARQEPGDMRDGWVRKRSQDFSKIHSPEAPCQAVGLCPTPPPTVVPQPSPVLPHLF